MQIASIFNDHGYTDQFTTQTFSKMDPITKQQVGIDLDDQTKVPQYIKEGLLTVVAATESLASVLQSYKEGRYKNLEISEDPDTNERTLSFNYANCPKDIIEKVTISLGAGPEDTIEALQKTLQNGSNIDFCNKRRTILYNGKQIPIMANKDKIPFTGDWDLLLMGHPHNLDAKYSKPINTFKNHETNIPKLLTLSQELFTNLSTSNDTAAKYLEITKKMQQDNLTFAELVSKFSLQRAGCITPYEFMQITIRNYLRHGKRAVERPTLNEIQHGPENRNPGKASDIDTPMITFFNGEIIITENAKDLQEFMLQNDAAYLKQNKIDINPRWDKQYWDPIRIAQARLNAVQQKNSNGISSTVAFNKGDLEITVQQKNNNSNKKKTMLTFNKGPQ